MECSKCGRRFGAAEERFLVHCRHLDLLCTICPAAYLCVGCAQ